MSPRTLALSDALEAYVEEVGVRRQPALDGLRAATDALPEGGMRSSTAQAALLAWLIELTGAERVLEIGCFTGYGTLAMALALPAHGRLTTLDVNDQWAAIGRPYWQEAGVAERIDFRSGPALDSLDALLADGARFDLTYIDADKKGYDDYYERALQLVSTGGIIALDNVLWHGAVANPENHDRQTQALRALNAKIHADPRVTPVLLPLGDGLTLARRR